MFSKQWHYSGADSSIGILVCGYPLNVPFQSIATPFGLSLQSTNVPHHLHKHHHSNVCKKHSLKLDNLSHRVKSTLILVWKSLPGVNFTPQCAIRFGVGCAYGCAPKTWSQVFTLVGPQTWSQVCTLVWPSVCQQTWSWVCLSACHLVCTLVCPQTWSKVCTLECHQTWIQVYSLECHQT